MSVLSLPVTVRALRNDITAQLVAAGVESPNAEARDSIAAVLDQSRFWPVDHGDDVLTEECLAAIREAVARRARGMPFAYAVGKAAFRHLTLIVDQRVLIPRQETELLIDFVLEETKGRGVVADVGTGSGCIALALATEGRYEQIVATDLSPGALTVAELNLQALTQPHVQVSLRHGDLLAPLTPEDRITAIVSNPPYIAPDEFTELPPSVRDWEPHEALLSADDGLAHTVRIVDDAPRVLAAGGLLALEVDSRRARRVADYTTANGSYRDIQVLRDLTDRDRFVLARIR